MQDVADVTCGICVVVVVVVDLAIGTSLMFRGERCKAGATEALAPGT
jgi:hypothetical protein